MPSSTSNDNGRALEYAVSYQLELNQGTLSQTAKRHQNQYREYFEALEPDLRSDFFEASERIARWVQGSLSIANSKIDKSLDSDLGTADVMITQGKFIMNLSLKHNHLALKHQRPYSLAQQSGFIRHSPQDVQHRNRMQIVEGRYRKASTGLSKYTDNDPLKFKMLGDVCDACSKSINEWSSTQPGYAKRLFEFLVSNNCYQVVVRTRKKVEIVVYDYNSVTVPNSVFAESNGHYVQLYFDNGFTLSLRLHTASSKISQAPSQLSLKFDTKKLEGSVETYKLP